MTTGLTTLDGFPRSDIDVAQGRAHASWYQAVADLTQYGQHGRASYG